jgi:hypothetical protein
MFSDWERMRLIERFFYKGTYLRPSASHLDFLGHNPQTGHIKKSAGACRTCLTGIAGYAFYHEAQARPKLTTHFLTVGSTRETHDAS